MSRKMERVLPQAVRRFEHGRKARIDQRAVARLQHRLLTTLTHARATVGLVDEKIVVAAIMFVTMIADDSAGRETDVGEIERTDAMGSNAAAKLPPPIAHDAIRAADFPQRLVGCLEAANLSR